MGQNIAKTDTDFTVTCIFQDREKQLSYTSICYVCLLEPRETEPPWRILPLLNLLIFENGGALIPLFPL